VRFLFKWLRVERPPGVALHPTRTIELDVPPSAAFERSVLGIENTLGGVVRDSDRDRGTIEATFGLIDSERLSVAIEPLERNRSRVVIESRRGAMAQQPSGSQYVDALADYLRTTE
jgi:hypothetical protein